MSTQESLLQAIRESPFDDTLRLVYADWLEDHGDTAQAEIVRLQCEAQTLSESCAKRTCLEQQANKLWTRHRKAIAGAPPRGQAVAFDRGLLCLKLSKLNFENAEIGKWWKANQHRFGKVELIGTVTDSVLQQVVDAGWLDGIPELDYEPASLMGQGLAIFPEVAHIRILKLRPKSLETLAPLIHLQKLHFSSVDQTYDFDLHFLQRFPQLQDLSFQEAGLTGTGFRFLKEAHCLRSLCVETYADCLSQAGVQAVAELPSLERLSLNTPHLEEIDSWLEPLAAAPHLTELLLSGGQREPTRMGCLGQFQHLRRLRLDYHFSLAWAPEQLPPRLESLALHTCSVGRPMFAFLPEIPTLKELTVRDLNVLPEDLAELTRFPNLRSLTLQHVRPTAESLQPLAQLSYLEELALEHTDMRALPIKQLVKMKNLKYLSAVDIRVSKKEREQLHKELPDLVVTAR